MKKQRIPRHFKKLIATIHVQTSATEPGDRVEVIMHPKKSGYLLTNLRTGQDNIYFFNSYIHNPELITIDEVIK